MNKFLKNIIIAASVLISIFSVILFYKAGLGINFIVFNIFLAIIIIAIAYQFKRINSSLILNSILLFFLSIPFAITSSGNVKVILFLGWMYFLVLTIYTLVKDNSKYKFWQYLTIPFEQIILSFISPFFPLSRVKMNKSEGWTVVLKIGIGILVAIPFLTVFLFLLMSADLVFKDLIGNIFELNWLIDLVNIITWICAAFWISIGAFYYNLYKKDKYKEKEETQEKSSRFFIESITILSLVEVLFLIFNIIQITYLFGGESLIQNGDFTYSEYARRGFFELITVSVIALGLIAALFKIKRTSTKIQEIIMRAVGLFGIIELVPMTISAFYKLYLYEDSYGFTRLRVYSHLFIVFLIIIFLWFAVKFLSKLKENVFLYGIELITIISLIIVGVINVDSVIADFNIKRYQAEDTEEIIDLAYLHTLSYDATPKLVQFWKNSTGEVKEEAAFYLESKYYSLLFKMKQQDFREFNIRKKIAYDILEKNIEDIKIDSKKYEEKIKSKYFNIHHDKDYYNCHQGKIELILIDIDGYSSYRFYITEIYDFKDFGKKTKIENISYENYNRCVDLSEGKYFIKRSNDFRRYQFESTEIHVFDVKPEQDHMFIISRL